MRYLILSKGNDPVTTNKFNPNHHFGDHIHTKVTVIDLKDMIFTTDGDDWEEVENIEF